MAVIPSAHDRVSAPDPGRLLRRRNRAGIPVEPAADDVVDHAVSDVGTGYEPLVDHWSAEAGELGLADVPSLRPEQRVERIAPAGTDGGEGGGARRVARGVRSQ